MEKVIKNPCITCGKERIVIKVFKEKIGNAVITNTITACSDPKCQKGVDNLLAKEKARRDEIQTAFRKREKLRAKKILLSRTKKARLQTRNFI